jgi:hypothetical protein
VLHCHSQTGRINKLKAPSFSSAASFHDKLHQYIFLEITLHDYCELDYVWRLVKMRFLFITPLQALVQRRAVMCDRVVVSGVHDVICTTVMLWSVACMTSYVQQLCCGQWRASCYMYNSYVVASGVHDVIRTTVMLWSVACIMLYV